MRKIKFRLWDKKSKKVRHIDSLAFNDEEEVKLVNAWGYNIIEDKPIIVRREKQYELLQYTGLKDKNGKEIYEGDIVSTDLSRPYLIVEFRNGAFMYQCHHGGQDYYDHMESAFEDEKESTKYHTVIGNIYENPELLQ